MKFRYARHTNNIDAIKKFYIEILNFELLGSFQDHNGYNGVFLGKKGLNWHLEFTSSDEKCNQQFDEDDLLVFYPENRSDFDGIYENIINNKIEIQKAKNPYWKGNGILIKDSDGFGIVIVKLAR